MNLRSLLSLFACLLFVASNATAQVPADFLLLGSSGGDERGSEQQHVTIDATGSGIFTRTVSDRPGDDPLERTTFQLSPTELEALWQSIQDNHFFDMDPAWVDSSIDDRTYALLTVRANSVAHKVLTKNLPVPAFDAVVETLNSLTPSGSDLVYDTSAPPTWETRTLCEIAGKTDGLGYAGQESGTSSKSNRVDLAVGPATDATAHAGTTVSATMSLQEAVQHGLVVLEGKGGYHGDRVTVKSTAPIGPPPKPIVTVKLYLEFYGTGATAANALKAKNAIEAAWSGKTTTGGKELKVEVVTRTSTAAAAPGTAGYHQIELKDADGRSYVSGRGRRFNVNEGTGSGVWYAGDPAAEGMYRHEAGHLLGEPDLYQDYNKGADGKWTGEKDGSVLTQAQIIERLKADYPGQTAAWYTAAEANNNMLGINHEGKTGHLMADAGTTIDTSIIDNLAGKAGITITVKPGDVLVNKDGTEQNLGITAGTEIHVKSGESKTVNGLYSVCIDHHEGSPSYQTGFDVAPNLADWTGTEIAATLLRFLEYVDQNVLYCGNHSDMQRAVWRITDNDFMTDSDVTSILASAGIDLGTTVADFPRLENPNAGQEGSALVFPPRTLEAEIVPTGSIVGTGQTMNLDTLVPDLGSGYTVTYGWTLEAPTGSAATLSSSTTPATSFTTDVAGLYVARLAVTFTTGTGGQSMMNVSSRILVPHALTDTFERSTIWTPSFPWEQWVDHPWLITNETASTGSQSARSAVIGDNQYSDLSLTIDTPTDTFVGFTVSVSSERGYDRLQFLLDGNEKAVWSGDVPWTTHSEPISSGRHTLVWRYDKDGSTTAGHDVAYVDDIFFPLGSVLTSVDSETIPTRYMLEQNWPNPFNRVTNIAFELPTPKRVELSVFDLLGRRIAVLVDGMRAAGRHVESFDASGLPAGMYVYRIASGDFTSSRRLVIVR